MEEIKALYFLLGFGVGVFGSVFLGFLANSRITVREVWEWLTERVK